VAKETKCPSTAITNLFMHKKDREICTTLGTGLDLTLVRVMAICMMKGIILFFFMYLFPVYVCTVEMFVVCTSYLTTKLSKFGVHVLGVKMGGFVSGVSIQVTDVTIQQAARSTVLVVIYQGSTV